MNRPRSPSCRVSERNVIILIGKNVNLTRGEIRTVQVGRLRLCSNVQFLANNNEWMDFGGPGRRANVSKLFFFVFETQSTQWQQCDVFEIIICPIFRFGTFRATGDFFVWQISLSSKCDKRIMWHPIPSCIVGQLLFLVNLITVENMRANRWLSRKQGKLKEIF